MKPSVQWVRHLVQVLVFSFIFIIPAVTYYRSQLKEDNFKLMLKDPKRDKAHEYVLKKIDAVLKIEKNRKGEELGAAAENESTQEFLKDFQGNHWATKIYGVKMMDPLAGLESTVASGELWLPILIGLWIPVVLTLLLGRIFCSWLCPAGFLFEINDKLRMLLKKFGVSIRNIKLWKRQNILVLITGLVISFILSIPVLIYFYPPAILARDIHHSIYQFFDYKPVLVTLATSLTFFMVMFLIELFISRRMWCTYLCPGGALYSLLGTFRVLRVQLKAQNCTDCGNCVQACPMNLNPMKGQLGNQCDSCQLCINSCEDNALKMTFTTKDILGKKQTLEE